MLWFLPLPSVPLSLFFCFFFFFSFVGLARSARGGAGVAGRSPAEIFGSSVRAPGRAAKGVQSTWAGARGSQCGYLKVTRSTLLAHQAGRAAGQ